MASYTPPSAGAGALTASDANKYLSSGLGSGVASGGVLSIGSPNTTFSITDGKGYLLSGVDSDVPVMATVSWSGKTNVAATQIAANPISWVSIDSNGDIQQRIAPPTAAQRRAEIQLGVLVHVDRAVIDAVNNEQVPSAFAVQQVADLMAGLGFFNISGNVISANGANLNIDKSVGVMFGQGINYANDYNDPHKLSLPAITAASFQYRFLDGTNGVTGTAVDPNIKDVAGVSTAVGTNKFTVQRVYSFTSNNVKIQPGQTEYTSLSDAEAAIPEEGFVTEPSIKANGLLRGFLIVQEGATDLSSPTSAKFISALRFGTKDYI